MAMYFREAYFLCLFHVNSSLNYAQIFFQKPILCMFHNLVCNTCVYQYDIWQAYVNIYNWIQQHFEMLFHFLCSYSMHVQSAGKQMFRTRHICNKKKQLSFLWYLLSIKLQWSWVLSHCFRLLPSLSFHSCSILIHSFHFIHSFIHSCTLLFVYAFVYSFFHSLIN